MKTLQEWKDVITKHGIECECYDGYGKGLTSISIDLYYLADRAIFLGADENDHEAAEFVSCLTANVFGEWAYYVPLGDEGYPNRWGLCDPHGLTAPASLVGQGPTKLDALYDALTRKEPKP